MNKTTKQILDRTLKKNPQQLEDTCLDLWKNRNITIREFRIYREKFYKIMKRLRRQQRIRKAIQRILHPLEGLTFTCIIANFIIPNEIADTLASCAVSFLIAYEIVVTWGKSVRQLNIIKTIKNNIAR